MNCVPGMTTKFYVEPTISTAEMRKITKNDKFDYVLLCNKICGVAHYNMKMKMVIDEPAAFDSWLKGEKPAMEGVKMPTADSGAEIKPPSNI
jgi:cytochrome c oxidase subunit 2